MLLLGGNVAGARMQLSGDEWTSPTYGFSVSRAVGSRLVQSLKA